MFWSETMDPHGMNIPPKHCYRPSGAPSTVVLTLLQFMMDFCVLDLFKNGFQMLNWIGIWEMFRGWSLSRFPCNLWVAFAIRCAIVGCSWCLDEWCEWHFNRMINDNHFTSQWLSCLGVCLSQMFHKYCFSRFQGKLQLTQVERSSFQVWLINQMWCEDHNSHNASKCCRPFIIVILIKS